MKDILQKADVNENNRTTNFNLLKAFVQFSIQVADEARAVEFPDLLKKSSPILKESSSDQFPPVWMPGHHDPQWNMKPKSDLLDTAEESGVSSLKNSTEVLQDKDLTEKFSEDAAKEFVPNVAHESKENYIDNSAEKSQINSGEKFLSISAENSNIGPVENTRYILTEKAVQNNLICKVTPPQDDLTANSSEHNERSSLEKQRGRVEHLSLENIIVCVENNLIKMQKNSALVEKCEKNSITKHWRKTSKKKSKEETRQDKDGSSAASEISDIVDHMSMQQQLALTALNLTVPVCASVLKNYRNNWVQLSGHPGSLSPAGLGTIWKKQPGDTNEARVYESLMKDSAKEIVPKFYKEIFHEADNFLDKGIICPATDDTFIKGIICPATEIQFNSNKYIEISDLLYGFSSPCVMDIKMGTRTFLESEVSNKKLRNDLYFKMLKVDPSAPTPEERSREAVTKLRYMDLRDTMSSSRSLGFRVDALKMADSPSVTETKKVHTWEEVVETLTSFIQKRESVKKQIVRRLNVIKETFENSEFFKKHEVIGSSILIVYDDTHAGTWIIDFAKTCQIPECVEINHRDNWALGNHEEGYLTGLENLLKAFQETSVNKSRKIKFFGK